MVPKQSQRANAYQSHTKVGFFEIRGSSRQRVLDAKADFEILTLALRFMLADFEFT